MESLKIDSGVKRLMINDDPENVIEFNPDDILFAKKYEHMLDLVGERLSEIDVKVTQLKKDMKLNEFGIPNNIKEQLNLTLEFCDFTRDQIDIVFGNNTSQRIFGEERDYKQIFSFLDGITSYFGEERGKFVSKYTNKRNSSSKRKAVMK